MEVAMKSLNIVYDEIARAEKNTCQQSLCKKMYCWLCRSFRECYPVNEYKKHFIKKNKPKDLTLISIIHKIIRLSMRQNFYT